MGIHTRVGLAAGALGFLLLALAQLLVGAAAVVLALLVGLGAGLGTAKWLPRAWYGRQLAAGARAGLLACGVALGGFLISLIAVGAHSTTALAARSHLVGIDLGPAVRAFGVVGWLGAGMVLALLALAVGTGVAALAGQVGAWDKDQHAIEVVARARAAAQHSGRLASVSRRTLPHLRGTLPPEFGLPSAATPMPPGASDSIGDLAGLNESWHSLRSPLNVFPPPAAPEKPWSRYDERLPPGALLPDEFAPDAGGSGAVEGDVTPGAADTGPSAWDSGAWRADAGWMDYEDSGLPSDVADEPALDATPLPAGDAEDEGEADVPGAADGEADSWLN